MIRGKRVSVGLVTGFGMLLGGALTGAACVSSSSPPPRATSDGGGITPGDDAAVPSTDAGDAAVPVGDASSDAADASVEVPCPSQHDLNMPAVDEGDTKPHRSLSRPLHEHYSVTSPEVEIVHSGIT